MPNITPARKIKKLLSLFQQGNIINKHATARKYKISRNTVKHYLQEFETLKILHPEKLEDERVFIRHLISKREIPHKRQELLGLVPSLLSRNENRNFDLVSEWKEYKGNAPDGYGYSQFCSVFREWRKSIGLKQISSYKRDRK